MINREEGAESSQSRPCSEPGDPALGAGSGLERRFPWVAEEGQIWACRKREFQLEVMCPPSAPLLASQHLLFVLPTTLVTVRGRYFLPLKAVDHECYLIFLQLKPVTWTEESNSNLSSMRQSCIEKAEAELGLFTLPFPMETVQQTWDLRPETFLCVASGSYHG